MDYQKNSMENFKEFENKFITSLKYVEAKICQMEKNLSKVIYIYI